MFVCVPFQVYDFVIIHRKTPGGFNYFYYLQIFHLFLTDQNFQLKYNCGYNHISWTWRNTNIQRNRTIFWWDEPQLTSVTELSEQKLPLVTPPTCTVISALSFRKTSRLGSLSCFQRFIDSRFQFNVLLQNVGQRTDGRHRTLEGGREGGTVSWREYQVWGRPG